MGDMTREPSMEEILSSIRRVIARDEARITGADADDAARDSADAAPMDAANDPDVEDVLELTAEHGAPHEISAPDETAGQDGTDALLSADSAAISRQSLDVLSQMVSSADATSAPMAGNGDITIQQMTENLLRPMLREWLDAHLPPLVETLVAREIARITNRR